jgi:RNA ligase
MKIDFKSLENQGLITISSNEAKTLFIANYTAKVQYENMWTDDLMQCRGLIFDQNNKIIARPFKKFFNVEQHQDLPREPFDVFEKADGSLGILYFDKDTFKIATRGSFKSKQAIKANELLSLYNYNFNKNYTYLFEIIYPENRVVVDYGKSERLILLGIIETRTGTELSIKDVNFPDKVKQFQSFNDLEKLKKIELENAEGFVLRFQSGLRVKMKFSEYIRLHRIITQVSSKVIWKYLKNNDALNELIENVPDEFYKWVKSKVSEFKMRHQLILTECIQIYRCKPIHKTRKEFAYWAKKQEYTHILFLMFDGRDTSDIIWKMLEPEHEKPFKGK